MASCSLNNAVDVLQLIGEPTRVRLLALLETQSFDAVIADAHKAPSAVWSLGKTLAEHAIKARMSG